ncbi:helix-turn-helix transcriptional regulator [Aquibacillus sediminis]|uniref:helix-turn-helix transcriptional regulator n=1 Tax=Aquibacillus sediminis TaxID=2574734 RepID=UPI00110955B0|nr:helix-turn-helix transcriptional regulator [Aquibacillus sediminis]
MKREWLIQARKLKHYTQEQIAAEAYIDRTYYSQIETGKRNPGLHVAIKIADILNFEPLLFYKDSLDQNSQPLANTTFSYEVTKKITTMNTGEILYLYNTIESHTYHSFAFLYDGVSKGIPCLLIDNSDNFNSMMHHLSAKIPQEQLKKFIQFVDIDKQHWGDLEAAFKKTVLESKFLRIWCGEHDKQHHDLSTKLENYLGKHLKTNNLLSVHSYDASMITAGDHINMMRMYPYMMTDSEITTSPFFVSSPNTQLSPSLFMQEKNRKKE